MRTLFIVSIGSLVPFGLLLGWVLLRRVRATGTVVEMDDDVWLAVMARRAGRDPSGQALVFDHARKSGHGPSGFDPIARGEG